MEQSGSVDQAPALSDAEERRDVVAQATGVLVAQFGIDSQAAVEKTRRVASDSDRSVLDVAWEIVENNRL